MLLFIGIYQCINLYHDTIALGKEPITLDVDSYHGRSCRAVFGVIAIWFCNNVPMDVAPASSGTLSGLIGQGLQPLLAPLGINSQLSVALLFGFIAKEIVLGGLAVIYATSDDKGLGAALAGQIDWVQGYSFMLFTLLYVPCLSTIAVIKSESKSAKFAAFSVVWSLVLAWAASFVFYQGARFFGY
jgi:ferrous iron transport protein B